MPSLAEMVALGYKTRTSVFTSCYLPLPPLPLVGWNTGDSEATLSGLVLKPPESSFSFSCASYSDVYFPYFDSLDVVPLTLANWFANFVSGSTLDAGCLA